MSGILLVVVAVLWLVTSYWLAKLISRILPASGWRAVIHSLLFLTLISLPLIDEIVGKIQFEQLCEENATIHIDRAKAIGKTVYLANVPDTEVKGTWVRVVIKPWQFVNAKTGEPVVSYNTLAAEGGLFVRTLRISEGGVPLTFKSTCVPQNRPASAQAFRELGINYIEPPRKNMEK